MTTDDDKLRANFPEDDDALRKAVEDAKAEGGESIPWDQLREEMAEQINDAEQEERMAVTVSKLHQLLGDNVLMEVSDSIRSSPDHNGDLAGCICPALAAYVALYQHGFAIMPGALVKEAMQALLEKRGVL